MRNLEVRRRQVAGPARRDRRAACVKARSASGATPPRRTVDAAGDARRARGRAARSTVRQRPASRRDQEVDRSG